MNKLLLLTGFIALSYGSHSQEMTKTQGEQSVRIEENVNAKSLFTELKGTFQIKYSNVEQGLLITKDLLSQIESTRKENEDTWLVIDENVKVFILSRSAIAAPNFKPLELNNYSN